MNDVQYRLKVTTGVPVKVRVYLSIWVIMTDGRR